MHAANGLQTTSYTHVLLPLDGSKLSAAALPTAQALARRFGARLTIITVAASERESQKLRQRVGTSVEVEGTAGPVDVVIGDEPAQVIVDRAAELERCVVCMSTIGRGRVGGALIGSTARRVLQSCRQPLVAVGRQADRPPMLSGRPPRRPASWPEPLSVPRIVAAVDGSAASETVLPVAARWASALDMQLAVLTVAEETATIGSGSRRNAFGPRDPQAYVDELAARWRDSVADTVAVVASDPISPAAGIAAHLAAEPAGLVALTAHARSGMDRIRLGATAADILRTSPVPALVVPLSSD